MTYSSRAPSPATGLRLRLRVSSNGRRAWCVRYRVEGERLLRPLTLKVPFPTLSLVDARGQYGRRSVRPPTGSAGAEEVGAARGRWLQRARDRYSSGTRSPLGRRTNGSLSRSCSKDGANWRHVKVRDIANTLRVPLTEGSAVSIAVPIFSISATSAQVIVSPTGVRMPVDCMSIRPLTGIVQAFDTRDSSGQRSSRRPAGLRKYDRACGAAARAYPLRRPPRYHVSTRRHSDVGLSVITVSSIESGAGSVLGSARPALPSTRSTSGTCLMARSLTCTSLCASPIAVPGIVVGM